MSDDDDDDHEIRMLWCLSFIFIFEKKKPRNDETHSWQVEVLRKWTKTDSAQVEV